MKVCTKCGLEKPFTEFYKASKSRKEPYRAACKVCTSASNKKWYQENKEYHNELSSDWYQNNKERVSALARQWRTENREQYNRKAAVKTAERRAAYAARSYSELDAFAFEEARELAALRSEQTGVKWEVDHIVPLNHENASGLHVAANFQVVPQAWNRAKLNRTMDLYIEEAQ